MKSIDIELAEKIRHDILIGKYSEGERLSEAQLCDTHGVSRTPVRLAIRLLEREGVLRRGDGRGYLVQSPTVEDIKEAVLVRGHLESLGARLIAQSSERHLILPNLEAAIDEIDKLISLEALDDKSIRNLQKQNAVFHQTILQSCGNDFVGFTCNQINHLPMLEVGSMAFDRTTIKTTKGVERTLFRLRLGNAQHKVIYHAIRTGDGVRAEGVMREHSNTMIEYIELFEKRHEELTLSDLISYSGYEMGVKTDSGQLAN
jgi:GntR family transcriptional regulator of vanillate catabolism|tara:strand:+ start:224 stop:1000 length:777 start_codon:yes stop_codon:yes gene_type:complete